MNEKRNIWFLAFIIPVAFFLSSCARNRGEEKILLRWSADAYPVYDKFRAEESKKFEKLHPEVTVRYEPIPGGVGSRILTQIAGRTAPDMFVAGDLNTYISKGALIDLTDWYEEDKEYFKEIYPSLIESMMWEGRLYALPGNCNVDILYYNRDIFDEKGISYPDEDWTWENLLEAAKKLTKKDKRGNIIQFGCVFGPKWLSFILQNGGKIWNENRTKCIINSPEAKEALVFWKDLYTKYKVAPTPLQMREQGCGELFIMGRAAMYLGNSWEVATFKIKSRKELNWDATLIPRAKGKKRFIPLAYLTYGIWEGSKHPKLAYELAKFMITPERIKFLVKVGDSLPIRPKGEAMDYYLSDSTRPEKAKKAMLKSLSLSKSFYRTVYNPYIPSKEQEEIIYSTLEKFTVTGELSAEEALENIEDSLNRLLEEKKVEVEKSKNE
ncbi:sugar ABC transporter substrate-binding protein [Candidatus Calescamantes bacterium]|nr:sugar ABC transporter substrate-binding protein [Candidatus Calescamantes bacterium]